MQEGKPYRTPDRPGRARRAHVEVASPFSLFAKELPPITPPRPSWANPSVAWTGQPGLSPALAGFATPGLTTEHVDAMGQTPRRSLKLPREMGSKPSQRSLSAAAVLVHSPELVKVPNNESRAAHEHLERLLSKDEATSGGVESFEERDQQEASRQQPSESRAASLNTPENDCLNPSTLSWEAACDQSKCAALAMASEVESTVAIAPTKHQVSMVDLWQPIKDNTAQQATVGWERKLESAGNVQTWHRSESGTEKSPLSHTAQEGQQSMSAGGKGQPIGESRPDAQHLHPGSVAALHAAGTPVPRRLSTSSGSKASVVPPQTPGDDMPMPLTIGPGITTSEPPKKCNCKKSRCLKLYCDCFAAGQYCKHSCSCQSCMNTADNRDLVVNMREQVRQRNPQAFQQKIEKQALGQGVHTGGLHRRGCHCKKSHCKKKYCECFQAGVNCGVHCKCEDCHNTPEDGLPPPPKIPKAGNTLAPQPLLSGRAAPTAHPSKTSPGTPPAMSMDVTMDSRRALQRNVKRRATWLPDTQAGLLAQQICKRVHSGPAPVLKSSVLSPPDMVWPAQNLAQAPAHMLENTGNDQQSKDGGEDNLCQQRINWPDHIPVQISASSPPSAPSVPKHQPDQMQTAPMASAQASQSETAPTLLYFPTLGEERPSHAYTSHMLLQLLAQTAGNGGLRQPRPTGEGQATLDAAKQLRAHASHARETQCKRNPSMRSGPDIPGVHTEDMVEVENDVAKVDHPGAQTNVHESTFSGHSEMCQGAPVEVWQACTGFSSGGQVVAGSAAAAQDFMSHDLDLQSPEKVSTASQMRMKRVAAGRTVISPGTGRFTL